jgi:N-acetylglucosamine-6-phosphate deacetylase
VDNYILTGAKICLTDKILENHAIVVKSGKIENIISCDKIFPNDMETVNLDSNDTVVPGFIDTHIHGTSGSDVMDASFDALETIATTVATQGVTSFLATTMTASDQATTKALSNIKNYNPKKKNQAKICGVHLEGPFLSTEKIGAQNGKFLSNPNLDLFKKWCTDSGHKIKKVTLAPELQHADSLITYMDQNNISPSIGHTNCSAKQATDAIKLGANCATHLFNAMSGVSHRKPGAATAILLSKNVYTELIVDGIHLSPEITNLVYNIKGSSKIILITDAMMAQNYGDGVFSLGGQEVTVKGNEARLSNGALAGSVLTMNKALINMISQTNCSFVDAIRMASTTPAFSLGLGNKIGSIKIGKIADLVVLDKNLAVKHTFVSS